MLNRISPCPRSVPHHPAAVTTTRESFMTSTGTDLEQLQDEIADLERRLKDAKSRLKTAPLVSLSATPPNNVGLSSSLTSYRQSH
jgi:hypothetical protein